MAHLINGFETGIVFKGLEGSAITFPEKLKPRCDKSPVRPIFVLVATDGTKEDALWGFACFKIVDVNEGDNLVSLFLGFLYLRVCKLDEAFDNDLDAGNTSILRYVFVLHKAFFGSTALAHVHAKLHKAEHNRLQGSKWG